MSWQQVGTTADLEPESALSVEVRAASGAVVPVCIARDCHGTWHAVGDICTHEDVNLSDGEVFDTTIECPKHGAEFDLCSGRALTLPAVTPVPVYPLTCDNDGRVFIDVDTRPEEK